MLTDEIVSKAREMLGDDIQFDTASLRLMAYIQYVMVNEQEIHRTRINEREMDILFEWDALGLISYCEIDEFGETGSISVTKKFWDAMNEILWLGYVVRGEKTQ